MMLYGLVPTGGMMFAVAMVHAVSDGFTISSTGVAVGMVVPGARQAGAQGVLGGFQTLVAGASAVLVRRRCTSTPGGRPPTPSTRRLMVVLVVAGALLARSAWDLRGAPVETAAPVVVDPVLP